MLCALAAALVVGVMPALADDTLPCAISIDESTAIVTKDSGYHIKATIANNGSEDQPAGTVQLLTNASYTFVSRTDLQDWANATNTSIATPHVLGTADVPALSAGDRTSVTIDVAADQEVLVALSSWGAKPVQLLYVVNDVTQGRTTTFLTKSREDVRVQTPAMQLTVALPLASNSWKTNDSGVKKLLNDQDDDDVTNTLALSDDAETNATNLTSTIAKHSGLQTVAEPAYLAALGDSNKPQVNALAQPALFDITAYSALNDADAYTAAGITDQLWNADAAKKIANSSATPIAWQGTQPWTTEALTKARSQGYATVIADDSFDVNKTNVVHTGTYVVNTSAGEVKVLKSQAELSQLAQGKATSEQASAENSDAGRLARFMAQSAFYQMEEPYNTRYLLVTMGADASASWVDSLMSSIEQASWLSLTDLSAMANAEAYNTSDQGSQSAINEDALNTTRSVLDSLKQNGEQINRVSSAILKKEDTTTQQSNDADKENTSDPQALARQDADSTAKHSTDPKAWIASLHSAQAYCGMHALSGTGDEGYRQRAQESASSIASRLIDSVQLTPSETVTTLSESAQMPVTITNELPYAVKVSVKSETNSEQIDANGSQEVEIAAHSSEQVTFTIYTANAGNTTARVSLFDQQGNAFGRSQETPIICALRINDISGFIIIGIAVLLGIVGLWRQFRRNRKKEASA